MHTIIKYKQNFTCPTNGEVGSQKYLETEQNCSGMR